MILSKSIKSAFFIAAVVLMGANIYLFSRTIEITDKLSRLEVSISALKQDNQLLQKKYYSNSSIANLEKLALDLGFSKKAGTIYLKEPDYAFISQP